MMERPFTFPVTGPFCTNFYVFPGVVSGAIDVEIPGGGSKGELDYSTIWLRQGFTPPVLFLVQEQNRGVNTRHKHISSSWSKVGVLGIENALFLNFVPFG